MSAVRPEWLWLLLALVPLVGWDLVRTWRCGPVRRGLGVATRAVLVAAVLLALVEPVVEHPRTEQVVVYAIDRSQSIPDEQLERALAQVEPGAAVVLFDGTAEVLPPDRDVVREAPERTDLGAGLHLALALVPADAAGQVVLMSDGRGTEGSVDAAVELARARGVVVRAVVLDPARAESGLGDLSLDQVELSPGATLSGRVEVIGGTRGARGQVELMLGEEPVHTATVDLEPGEATTVPFEGALPDHLEPGLAELTARLVTPGSESRTSTGLVITRRPRVCLVVDEPRDGTHLAEVLRAEGMEVDLVGPADLPVQLDAVDLVVLAGVPAVVEGRPVLPAPFLEALARFVDEGGGLVALGGEHAYDLGGYGDTVLAELLPVELEPQDAAREDAVTLVVILDKSGSMAQRAGAGQGAMDAVVSTMRGGTPEDSKMRLADEAAVAAIEQLRPWDQVGVMAVDSEVQWIVEVQEVGERPAFVDRVREIGASGGGIYVFTSLLAAQEALESVDTPLRHVLLFADAGDAGEQSEGLIPAGGEARTAHTLADELLAEGVTLSVIGIGKRVDKDAPFLEQLAERGAGRFLLASDAGELKSLFVEETRRLVDPSLVEEDLQARRVRWHPSLRGVDLETAPPLHGHHRIEPRPRARTVLESAAGDALMVEWHVGLGQVVAVAFDAGQRWSASWLRWPGYARLWTQLARHLHRRPEGREVALEVEPVGSDLRIRLARRDAGGLSVSGARPSVRVEAIDRPGTLRRVDMRPVEPGLWEATLHPSGDRPHRARALDAEGRVLAERSFVPPPAPELRHRTPDRELLADIERRTTTAGSAALASSRTVLWPWLLLLAALLLPVDAFVRRPARG